MKRLSLLLVACLPALAMPESAAALLKRHAGFSDAQIAAVRNGQRVVRMIDTGDRAEVAFAAVSRLPVSYATYMQRAKAGTLYKARDPILKVHKLNEVPDWYRQSGEIRFGSDFERVDASKEFAPMAHKVAYLRERLPDAHRALLQPRLRPGDYFLWKQLTFGLRPVTRVAHVSVWEDAPGEAIVLMKQIYADRYFHSSFQIDHVITDADSVYLITLNYGRSSWLEGISGKMIRPIVVSRTQAMAEKTLDQARRDFMEERKAL